MRKTAVKCISELRRWSEVTWPDKKRQKAQMIIPRIIPTIALSILQGILHFAAHGLERVIVGLTHDGLDPIIFELPPLE